VGKSTLFNRLTGSRDAIVDDMPGVTRDRHYGQGEWEGRVLTFVDTGGFEPETSDGMLSLMRDQAQLAIDEADIIFFVLDARMGVTAADREIAEMLRRTSKPVFTLANKVEGKLAEALALEVYELGAHKVYATSGEHGVGIGDLMEDVADTVPLTSNEEVEDETEALRIAVVGRPNVGKSSIINRLLGEPRLLASDVPGTTRDSIDTVLDLDDGRRFLLIDTAGIRRKRSIAMRVEMFSVVQAMRSVERANVVVLVLDATQELSDQDARLASLIEEKGRAAILAFNKWDAVEKDSATAGNRVREFREKIPSCAHWPSVFLSALSGQRVSKILDLAAEVHQRAQVRITTGQLNRFFHEVIERHPPPTQRGKMVKIYYLSQVAVDPIVIVAHSNFPDAISEGYRRYLVNQLREHVELDGVPVRIYFRGRGASEINDKRRGRRPTPR
jgi:GTP-binding protein